MKKWNTPEVTELNITETANGSNPGLAETDLFDTDCICPDDANHVHIGYKKVYVSL